MDTTALQQRIAERKALGLSAEQYNQLIQRREREAQMAEQATVALDFRRTLQDCLPSNAVVKSRLTHRQAALACQRYLGEGFKAYTYRMRFGSAPRSIGYSTKEQPLMVYNVAEADTWEEAILIAMTKLTVSTK